MKKVVLAIFTVISLFGFNLKSNPNSYNHYSYGYMGEISGKVINAYTQIGYGRRGFEWLFMDIKTNDGVIYHVAIAPTFKIPNLPIRKGDNVKVDAIRPPMFPQDSIKAMDIYDISQKKDYPITNLVGAGLRYGRGARYGIKQ